MSRYDFEDPAYGGGGVQPQFRFPKPGPAIKWLLIANAGVAVLQLIFHLATRSDFGSWFVTSLHDFLGNPLLGVFQLFSYQFVHDVGGLGHLLMNMLVVYFFGTMVEEELGAKNTVRLYLFCGVLGGLFWWLFSALVGRAGDPVIGASGSAYGILTYAAFLAPRRQVIALLFFVPLWVVAALFGVGAIYSTLIDLRAGQAAGTAHSAHVGGALAGALLWWQRGFLGRWRWKMERRRHQRTIDRAKAEEQRFDELLGKVKEVGMDGLTAEERRFMERYSKERQG